MNENETMNNEINEVYDVDTTETHEEDSDSSLAALAIIGGAAIVGGLVTRFVVIPVAGKVKKKAKGWFEKRKSVDIVDAEDFTELDEDDYDEEEIDE